MADDKKKNLQVRGFEALAGAMLFLIAAVMIVAVVHMYLGYFILAAGLAAAFSGARFWLRLRRDERQRQAQN